MRHLKIIALLLCSLSAWSQSSISGNTLVDGKPMPEVNLVLQPGGITTASDSSGQYQFKKLNAGTYEVTASFIGTKTQTRKVVLSDSSHVVLDFSLTEDNQLDEVVVTGTMKAVTRMESAVPVEVYSTAFLKKNPTASLFEGLQTVNGVRPQYNCNICNTGDIHINGLEGPYTLVMIDGMPIVSGLSTVYGLSGIPNSMIDKIEIVKGPASSLYGSEAVAGLINVITKNPANAPLLSLDGFTTSWGEANLDLGLKLGAADKFSVMTGLNYFNYSNRIDNNNDGFTDMTLQDRISVFQKWNFRRASGKALSLMGRYYYEDRWGGQMNWNTTDRGGDQVYGESIYTGRFEILGAYELPVSEKMKLAFSYTSHDQNSFYGNTPYMALQNIGFAQFTWDKKIKRHDLLFGAAYRYQYYNDNTPATDSADHMNIPGIFAQDEITLADKHHLLLGARYDNNDRHGSIFTPRLAYKWKFSENSIFRFNTGTGFRVVNLFTEDHAALTGARDVIIVGNLKPERSVNANVNYLQKFPLNSGLLTAELSGFYTHFSNAILPDYDSDPQSIIYKNLDGNAVSKGISLNLDYISGFGLKAMVGATLMDVSRTESGIRERQMLTERFTGTWAISYDIPDWSLTIDYTGNVYGPMRLPLAGPLDPRPEYSPTWSIQNIQFTLRPFHNVEFYAGVKNLLDWTPGRGLPFLIARSQDPFDQNVQYAPDGSVLSTPDNPYALTFDPSYVYGPNQGIRTFGGIRFTFR